MNVDELVRDALREQAAELTAPGPGFADRVLAARRRRRVRGLAAVAAATAAVIAVSVGVPALYSGGEGARPSGGGVEQGGITARAGQSPPRDLLAAGEVAMAAYFTTEKVRLAEDRRTSERTYWLLDPGTGKYEKDDRWSFVAVAPGLRTAAVLERELPAGRIGLLDLASGEVERWIPVEHEVAGLAFSPDGRKLVATTYGENPDVQYRTENPDGTVGGWQMREISSRNGFQVIDVASGTGSWTEVGTNDDPMSPAGLINSRQDFAFSADGRFVWAGRISVEIPLDYFDLDGDAVAPPPREAHRVWHVDAGLSPDGRRLAGDFAGKSRKTSSWILDPRTGEQVAEIRGQQLLAWADDDSLVAWDIGADGDEFHQRLVLVTVGSDRTVPLSGFRSPKDDTKGRWEPVFARR
ncbi:WD40 repeat domain-containing protein [Streptomyces sp. NPDC044984]|uniref:WD40 repeat domain-containing protein n=1 Tax=Streptomyces sp. NPDC044984 TaxID=3154335 RepID=UPI0033E715A5